MFHYVFWRVVNPQMVDLVARQEDRKSPHPRRHPPHDISPCPQAMNPALHPTVLVFADRMALVRSLCGLGL
jgi:hypothetical protein